jgi:flagellar biosynthesis protein FlhG
MGPSVRQGDWLDRAAGDAGLDLDAIDAELDHLGLKPSPLRSSNPRDDQATALRRLMESGTRTAPRPVAPAPPRPGITDRPAPAPRTADRPASGRFNILQAARRARVVAIASGKGGVGKTNMSVNTAIALARQGLRVTLVDVDLGTANADVICGLMPTARLEHVLAPTAENAPRSLADIAIEAPGGFRLVPGTAGIGRMADITPLERRRLVAGLVELAADSDILLIDTAAGVGQSVTAFVNAADLALLVTTPEPTAIADAYALVKCLVLESGGQAGDCVERMAMVVNQVREPAEAFATHERIVRAAERFLGVTFPMIGYVAQDVRIPDSVRAQKPLLVGYPDSPAARSIGDLSVAIVKMLGLHPTATPNVSPVRPAPRPASAESAATAPQPQPARGGAFSMVRRLLGFSSEPAKPADKN